MIEPIRKEPLRSQLVASLTAVLEEFWELHRFMEHGLPNVPDRQTLFEGRLVSESRWVLEAILERDTHSPEQIGCLLAAFTDALEEIDPQLFDDPRGGEY